MQQGEIVAGIGLLGLAGAAWWVSRPKHAPSTTGTLPPIPTATGTTGGTPPIILPPTPTPLGGQVSGVVQCLGATGTVPCPAGTVIHALNPDGSVFATAVVAPDCTYSFPGLPDGRWSLMAVWGGAIRGGVTAFITGGHALDAWGHGAPFVIQAGI